MGKHFISGVLLLAFGILAGFSVKGQNACPAIVANPDTTINCASACVRLRADPVSGNQTTSYVVSQINYSPYPYTGGTPVLINIDDTWSGVINLPFTFCFFGQQYSTCIIGSNGVISFNTANANGYNTWPISAAIPSPTPADLTNAIMCPWHDIDPSINQSGQSKSINWALYGTAPCRALVVSWYNIPLYSGSCNQTVSKNSTQQIVIYETTNIIETFIQNKQLCTSWNSGRAIHGIQDATGTVAYVVPGRNSPTQWTTTNDAWRFTPDGPPSFTVTWYDQNNNYIGAGDTLTVCPTQTTTYTARGVYHNCNGDSVVTNDNATITMNVPPVPVSASYSNVQNVTCNGGSNGSALGAGNGGQSPYTYSWNTSPPQSSAQANNLNAGVFVLTVTDAFNCIDTVHVPITQPAAMGVNSSVSPVSCFGGNNGTATVTPSGGAGGYTYSWNTTPVQTTQTATGLNAGSYSVTITDANNCSVNQNVLVPQPQVLDITLSPTHVTCFQAGNGAISSVTTGGTGPYTYLWSNAATTANLSNLAGGTYSVTVTDNRGCTDTASIVINEPSLFTVNANGNDPACFGASTGNLSAAGAGGTSNYTYSWNTSPVQNTANATNVPAGTFIVTATDAHGCIARDTVTLSQPTAMSHTTSFTPVICNGQSNGTATVVESGGTPGYTYGWATFPVQTGSTASNLSAGLFVVTIVDNNGCRDTAHITVTQPTALSVSTSISPLSCFQNSSGTATANPSGGTPGYTYSWNSNPVQTTQTATGLAAGLYGVTVTDNNGCTASQTAIIPQPQLLNISLAKTDVSCFGGSNGAVSSNTTGGTPAYQYLWSNNATTSNLNNVAAGTYSVTVTDNNGCTDTASIVVTEPTLLTVNATETDAICNGSSDGTLSSSASGGTPNYTYSWNTVPAQSTANVSGQPAGTYIVTVTDNHNCQAMDTVTIGQPTAIALTTGMNPVSCNGQPDGKAWVSASGGSPGYTYSWNSSPVQNTDTLFNATSGNYTVTVRDNHNCVATASVFISQPTVLNVSTTKTDVTCFGLNNGIINSNPAGGTIPYSYSWNTNPVQTTQNLANLAPGTYSLTVTDANGCTASTSNTITEPFLLTATTTVYNGSCSYSNDGNVVSVPNGGTLPYTYSWNTNPVQTTQAANGLGAGTYTVTITDAHGCTTTASGTVVPPPPLNLSVAGDTLICYGDTTLLTSSGSGGTGTLSLNWSSNPLGYSNPGSDFLVSPSDTTDFIQTLTDGNGCILRDTIRVYVAPLPVILITPSDTNGCDELNVTFANNSLYGAYWIWQFGDGNTSTNASPQHLYGNGTYSVSVTATSPEGCISSMSWNNWITVIPSPIADFTSAEDLNQPIGLAVATVHFLNLSQNAISYVWDFGDNSTTTDLHPVHNWSAVGNYLILLTAYNEFGCTDTAMKEIEVFRDGEIFFPNAFTPNGDGRNDYFEIVAKSVRSYHIEIFDRWGRLLYQADDLSKPWDGKSHGYDVQEGTYVWKVSGVYLSYDKFERAGTVTLFR